MPLMNHTSRWLSLTLPRRDRWLFLFFEDWAEWSPTWLHHHWHTGSLWLGGFWLRWWLRISLVNVIRHHTRALKIRLSKYASHAHKRATATPLVKSSCKNFPNLFFIVLDIEWLPEKLPIWYYIPGHMSGKNKWNWPYSLWTIEFKPTQLWPPQKSPFCDWSVWLRHGEKYHQPAMASHWDESNGGYSIAHCPNNADVTENSV